MNRKTAALFFILALFSVNSIESSSIIDSNKPDDDKFTSDFDASNSEHFSNRQGGLDSILKGSDISKKKSKKILTFSSEMQEIIDLNDPMIDEKYWRAIIDKDKHLARLFVEKDYRITNSIYNCEQFRKLLSTDIYKNNIKKTIDHLVSYQSHLFTSSFECEEDVFNGIHQHTADYMIKKYYIFRAAQENIFRESLRNPSLDLTEQFYGSVNSNTAWKRIDLAFALGDEDTIRKCCLLPRNLCHFNMAGETILTEAVINYDFERIKLLNMRSDAANLILLENSNGMSPIDLALNDEHYPDLFVFHSLLSFFDSALEFKSKTKLAYLLDKFYAIIRSNKVIQGAVKNKILEFFMKPEFEKFIPESFSF